MQLLIWAYAVPLILLIIYKSSFESDYIFVSTFSSHQHRLAFASGHTASGRIASLAHTYLGPGYDYLCRTNMLLHFTAPLHERQSLFAGYLCALTAGFTGEATWWHELVTHVASLNACVSDRLWLMSSKVSVIMPLYRCHVSAMHHIWWPRQLALALQFLKRINRNDAAYLWNATKYSLLATWKYAGS